MVLGQACQTCECIWMAIKNFSSNKLASGRNRDTKQGENLFFFSLDIGKKPMIM